jgi:hypothetical protein
MNYLTSTAKLSADGAYRYMLLRRWRADGTPPVIFAMLNPSTADGQTDDPTIRRCVRFANRWGHGGLIVINLYALRTSDPHHLRNHPDAVGPDNDKCLATHLWWADHHDAPLVVAWGIGADPTRVERFLAMPGAERAQCLGVTADGSPRHPLYMRADTELRPWTPAKPTERITS